jgi:TonB family protein
MKNLVVFLALFTVVGIVWAQEKTAEPGKDVTLKAGESAVVAQEESSPEELLPKNCKDWNVAELPGKADNIFVCKGGKWIEYVRKDKACLESKTVGGVGGGVYSAAGHLSEPVPIFKPDPVYSEVARKAKYQGTVVLWIVVDATGAVTDCRVVKPLGLGLDEKAVETVMTWKFKPAMRNGMPVPVRVMVEVPFRL